MLKVISKKIRGKRKNIESKEILTFVTNRKNSTYLQLCDETSLEEIVNINISDLLKNDIDTDMEFYSFLLSRADTIFVNYNTNSIKFALYI